MGKVKPYGKGKEELEGLKTAREKVSIPYGKGKAKQISKENKD